MRPPVALIDRAFAARMGGVDPVGKRLVVAGQGHRGRWHEIVGIVESLAPPGLGTRAAARPGVFLSALQHPPRAHSSARSGSTIPPSSTSASSCWRS
ncbi:MAG: hypothetical protein ACRELC_00310 [Gemmatimonadota bacterium]